MILGMSKRQGDFDRQWEYFSGREVFLAARVFVCSALLALILLLCLMASCASKNYVVHPGSASTFDSQAYDTLLTAEAAIDAAKASYAAGQLPPAAKGLLNDAIGVYDIAQADWHTYHDTALAVKSGDTSGLQTKLTQDLQQLTAAISQFEQAIGKKTPSASAKAQ